MKCASSLFISYYKILHFLMEKICICSEALYTDIKTIAENYFRSCFLCLGKIHNTKQN